MRRKLFNSFLLFLALGVSPVLNAQDKWVQRADFGGGNRQATCGFSIGTTLYMLTGNDSAVHNDVWAWSQASNTWAQKDTFPGGRRTGASAVSLFGKGYLLGGEHPSNCFLGKIGGGVCGGTFFFDIWQYSPDSDKWKPLAAFPGAGRDFAVAIADSVDSTIYYGLGNNGAVFLADWWAYNISTNSWKQIASFTSARNNAIGFFVNGSVYAGTGDDNDGKENAMGDIWKYDPAGDTWKAVAAMLTPVRREASAFVIGNKAYVCLGERSTSTVLNDLWVYDPVADTWTQGTNYTAGLSAFATGLSIGSKGYIGTGFVNNRDTASFWEYTPDTLEGINQIKTVTSSVSVYPNPSAGDLYVSYTGIGENSELNIIDVLGNVVDTRSIKNRQGKITLNESGLSNGIYFYQLLVQDKPTYTGKFIISKQ